MGAEKPPAFQFYPKDWLVDTAHMSNEETGAHMRLACYAAFSGGIPVNACDQSLIVGTTPRRQRRIWLEIKDQWRREGNQYVLDANHIGRTTWGKGRLRAKRMREAKGFTTAAQLVSRIAYYGGMCWICRTAPYEEIDHVKPISMGGTNWPANLRPACRKCNLAKGAQWPFKAAA